VDLVKNLLEDLNHSMPETFDVGEFKGNFVNSFKFLTIIIVPNISSSIWNFAKINDNFTLKIKKEITYLSIYFSGYKM